MKLPKGEEGRKLAEAVLKQRPDEIITNPDGTEGDAGPLAAENLVARKLRAQARNGVGPGAEQLPAAVFTQLIDRAFGKVKEQVGIEIERSDYTALSDEELAAKAAALASTLRTRSEENVH